MSSFAFIFSVFFNNVGATSWWHYRYWAGLQCCLRCIVVYHTSFAYSNIGRSKGGPRSALASRRWGSNQHGCLGIMGRRLFQKFVRAGRDGRPWRASEIDFWNKRHGFLTPIVSEVRQSGPWGRAVDGQPWRAAGMDFWNKRHGFLAPIVSKVSQGGPWTDSRDGPPGRTFETNGTASLRRLFQKSVPAARHGRPPRPALTNFWNKRRPIRSTPRGVIMINR